MPLRIEDNTTDGADESATQFYTMVMQHRIMPGVLNTLAFDFESGIFRSSLVNGNTYFRIRLDPKRLRHARLGRIRLNQLAAANSGSPSPLQLKRSGNAVIDGIVY